MKGLAWKFVKAALGLAILSKVHGSASSHEGVAEASTAECKFDFGTYKSAFLKAKGGGKGTERAETYAPASGSQPDIAQIAATIQELAARDPKKAQWADQAKHLVSQ